MAGAKSRQAAIPAAALCGHGGLADYAAFVQILSGRQLGYGAVKDMAGDYGAALV